MRNKYIRLIASLVLCQSAGIVGAQFTINSVRTWYPALNKPFFNPPNWVFAPVWTILYFLMGLALYLVLQSPVLKNTKKALAVFFIQLFLNMLWSLMFFGIRSILGGFVVILILWAAIFINIIEFRKILKASAMLLIPYLAWVSFAVLLNLAYLILN